MTELADRVVPVLAFLVCITVVAEISDRAGVFEVAGHRAAELARGRTTVLWLVVVLMSCVATTVLSLDTTAVLLTPVVITMARQARLNPLPFAFTTVWLANTASLLLPVSNLTNLLALHEFGRWGGFTAYLRTAWAPALAAMVLTAVVIAVLHGRSLRGSYAVPEAPTVADPVLFRVALTVCLLLAPIFVTGVTPAYPAAVAALVLVVTLAIRDRTAVRHVSLPWQMVIGVSVLFVVVDVAGSHGLNSLIADLTGNGDGLPGLLRVAAVGSLGANLVNNLPAYLAAESAAADSAHRLMALLIGVNAGPIITLWGSLATLLWRARCERAGLHIPLLRYTLESIVVAVTVVAGATAVLALV